MPRYWIGVASRDHVLRGVAGGFAQLSHGKAAPLRRFDPGDWIVYYSPRETHPDGPPCQAFTALGRVSGELYQGDMGGGFQPSRVDVEFAGVTEAPIRPLLGRLGFIRDPARWGLPFRSGLLEVSAADFHEIARAMDAPARVLEG
jgi:hypothetical protein